MLPRVSVIIPNYNHARYLPQRIDSILNQTLQNIEVLLLDDCSPDKSRAIIEEYAARDSRIQVVYNEQNSGSTFKQWNKGIALTKGEYIWLAESDDIAEPDFLEKLIIPLDTDKKVVISYSNSFDIDENDKIKGTWDWFLKDLDSLWESDFVKDGLTLVQRFMTFRNIIPNASAVVIRASTLREVGPAEENYKVLGDWLFWAKVISKGKVAYLSQPLNYFRTHSNNARSKNYLNGTGLEENSRVIVAMLQYGAPDQGFYQKAIDTFIDLWYYSIFYHKVPFSRHVSIYKNIAAIEPKFALKLLRIAGSKFFYRGSGLRILIGDKFLYRILKRK